MTDTCQIVLTYRGVLGHRGVRISPGSYGKTWALRLADGVWALTDHEGDEVHTFTQHDLHSKLAFPGFSPGYKDLYLVGLGPQVLCFQPEQEVVDALKRYAEQSERANAPQLAKWHRTVGLGFLAFGVLCLAACVALLSRALWGEGSSRFLVLPVVMPFTTGLIAGGGYFVVAGVGYFRQSNKFTMMAAASARPGA